MTSETGYPVSLLLEGPLFRDELETQPQHFKQDHELESLRLVPSKSAASGVHTIYFSPEHRHWALVRLAMRYRGLFEIQLQRGMSGEYQLLRQGFTSADLEFLSDIIPHPPANYSPVVYDMLWLVATYDEYLALTEAIVERETFVPREVLESTPQVGRNDEGFFRRFLRSHLIRPKIEAAENGHRRSNPEKADLTIDRDAEYELTDNGSEALRGIIAEYDRIFKRGEFEPLLIHPDRSPKQHLREYESEPSEPTPSISLDEVKDEMGILGEIADSFAPIEDELKPSTDESSASETAETNGASGDSETAEASETSEVVVTEFDESQHNDESATATEVERCERDLESSAVSRPPTTATGTGDAELAETTPTRSNSMDDANDATVVDDETDTNEAPTIGEFTESEIVDGAVAAAAVIDVENIVQTATVKSAAWESVDLGDRSRQGFWESVRDVLLEMDSVVGRPRGHIWLSGEFS